MRIKRKPGGDARDNKTPLLSRGGESRRGSGGWGGAGQQNIFLTNTTPLEKPQGCGKQRDHPANIPTVAAETDGPVRKREEQCGGERHSVIEHPACDEINKTAGDHARYHGQQFRAPVADSEYFK